ncbi:MAG: hypothetical protein WAU91_10560, partial [Desulfatitalea sp.]
MFSKQSCPYGRTFGRYLFITALIWMVLGAPLPAAAFWADLGVHGGKVLCLAIDPRNPNKIFAGTYLGNGLFL